MAIATRTTSMAHSTIKPAQSWRVRRTRPGRRRRNKSLPKRVLDGEGMWSSTKLGLCPVWARRGYPWLYPLAGANGGVGVDNPRGGPGEGGGDPARPAAAEAGGAHHRVRAPGSALRVDGEGEAVRALDGVGKAGASA